MSNHAVHTKEKATSVTTPIVAESGIPFVVGTAPIHTAENPAKVGVPVLITSWDEAVKKFGYSDNWDTYTLCEFMYSHFKLYACQPVIFCNILSPDKAKRTVTASDFTVIDGKVNLVEDAINDSNLIIKNGDAVLTKDTDYGVFYDNGNLIIELISDSTKSATKLSISYNAIDVSAVTNADIAEGFESAELCLTTIGIVPDLLDCPKYSSDPEIAAVMAAKASSINGLFSAKALCDIKSIRKTPTLKELEAEGKLVVDNPAAITLKDFSYTGVTDFYISHTGYAEISISGSPGNVMLKVDGVPHYIYSEATTSASFKGFVKEKIELYAYSSPTTVEKLILAEDISDYQEAIAAKKDTNLVQKEQIAFWPMGKLGDKKFHLSTHAAGSMAKIDTDNSGIPYESPSNKTVSLDSLCDNSGEEIILTHAQANLLNDNGIVTALNFIGGFVLWGNCTACYPANTDVKDNHIPVSRMFSWVGASLIRTFWAKLDRPMTRRLIDSILDSANIWLNGLVSRGYLLGARVEMIDAENPVSDLMKGIVRLHVYITPPSATQEIEFTLEYDASYIEAAFGA